MKIINLLLLALSLSANPDIERLKMDKNFIFDFVEELEISDKKDFRYDYNSAYEDEIDYKGMIFGEPYTIYNEGQAVYIDPVIISAFELDHKKTFRVVKLIEPTQIKRDNPKYIAGSKVGKLSSVLSYALTRVELEHSCKAYRKFLDSGKQLDIVLKMATKNFDTFLANVSISKSSCYNHYYNK